MKISGFPCPVCGSMTHELRFADDGCFVDCPECSCKMHFNADLKGMSIDAIAKLMNETMLAVCRARGADGVD